MANGQELVLWPMDRSWCCGWVPRGCQCSLGGSSYRSVDPSLEGLARPDLVIAYLLHISPNLALDIHPRIR